MEGLEFLIHPSLMMMFMVTCDQDYLAQNGHWLLISLHNQELVIFRKALETRNSLEGRGYV